MIPGMRPYARKRIHDLVAASPGITAAQIARRLGMSAAAVRHHLSILREDGRIDLTFTGVARPTRGRPQLRYRISERLRGDNLAMIAAGLLDAGRAVPARRNRSSLIDALSLVLSRKLAAVESGPGSTSQIASLVRRLNQLHYEARWEAGAEGPRIMFGHCPYAAIIEEHPELCQMDERAVATFMQASARQVGKIDPKNPDLTKCIFATWRTASVHPDVKIG